MCVCTGCTGCSDAAASAQMQFSHSQSISYGYGYCCGCCDCVTVTDRRNDRQSMEISLHSLPLYLPPLFPLSLLRFIAFLSPSVSPFCLLPSPTAAASSLSSISFSLSYSTLHMLSCPASASLHLLTGYSSCPDSSLMIIRSLI